MVNGLRESRDQVTRAFNATVEIVKKEKAAKDTIDPRRATPKMETRDAEYSRHHVGGTLAKRPKGAHRREEQMQEKGEERRTYCQTHPRRRRPSAREQQPLPQPS